MTSGQTRVLVLLLVLFGIELAFSQPARALFKSFGQALGTSLGVQPAGK